MFELQAVIWNRCDLAAGLENSAGAGPFISTQADGWRNLNLLCPDR